jgi:hypothetical protein
MKYELTLNNDVKIPLEESMSTKSWFGGALVLSAALSLAIAGGAWAQSQERGSGKGSGSYGAGQGTGSGSQYGKPQTPPAAGCKADDPMGVCAPPAASKKPKPSASRSPEPGTSK